jgi:hypothetical protein
MFEGVKEFFTEGVVTVEMIANAILYRQVISRRDNLQYEFGNEVEEFSLGEMAAPFLAFGDRKKGRVRREWVEFWIENEKLPVELGWRKMRDPIKLGDVLGLVERIRNATSLITGSGKGKMPNEKRGVVRDLYSGGV